jgi:glutamate-1-semialdehyde 2,1-aminomutase
MASKMEPSGKKKSVLNDPDLLYREKTRKSYQMFLKAQKIMPSGQSHNARFYEPYPFFAIKARGKYIWDVDGNRYVDYWMGHTALILGHSPPIVSKVIRENAEKGLLYGAPNKYALELAELVVKTVPCAETVRFCTTGAEATMYAVRLARAFSGRKLIAKIAGGWHGYSSALTVGVSSPYNVSESAGLVPEEERQVKLVEFNDVEMTRRALNEDSNEIAALILEPVLGAGGVLPAERSYLKFLREECDRLGILLIFDEIITGFRLALGGAQEYYGIRPDLCTLGKILGGGLPASAIAGRKDVMELADVRRRSKKERCWIGGGTFSENALPMKAGLATLRHLHSNRSTVYERIGSLGDKLRASVDKIFADNGVIAQTTGLGSLFATHFPAEGQGRISKPTEVEASNRALEKKYYFSLLAKDNIFFIPGHIGAISTVHERADTTAFLKATERFADSLTVKKEV